LFDYHFHLVNNYLSVIFKSRGIFKRNERKYVNDDEKILSLNNETIMEDKIKEVEESRHFQNEKNKSGRNRGK